MVFESDADDLVLNDANERMDVFVRDLQLANTRLISVSTNGHAANEASFLPVLSSDGAAVAFLSRATDLAPGDINSSADLYVWNAGSATTILASTDPSGAAAGVDRRHSPFISASGDRVVFASAPSDLVSNRTGSASLFWRDLKTGETLRVNTLPFQGWFACSDDGRYVAYNANPAFSRSIVLWDAAARQDVILMSVPGARGQHLSSDGGTLYYTSGGSALYALDIRDDSDEFIGLMANPAPQHSVSTSADRRWLAYVSSARSLSPGDTNNATDIVLVDQLGGGRLLVSSNPGGLPGNGSSDSPSLSADGRFLTFRSRAGDLVPGDNNNASDVFLYDRSNGQVTLLSHNRQSGSGDAPSILPLVSANGQVVVFQSLSSDLVEGDKMAHLTFSRLNRNARRASH